MLTSRTTLIGFRGRPHWEVMPRKDGSWALAFATPTQHGHRFSPYVGRFETKRAALDARRRIREGDLDPKTLER